MAASRAALTEVLTTDAYRTFNAIDAAMKEGLQAVDRRAPACPYVTGVGAKSQRSARRRRCASTVTRSAWTSASHTSPGCSSRTAGSSSRRGRSRRPGRSRCGTRTRTPGGTSRTSRPSRPRSPVSRRHPLGLCFGRPSGGGDDRADRRGPGRAADEGAGRAARRALAALLAFAERARRSLAGGVSCAWHALDPYTLYGERGEGSKIGTSTGTSTSISTTATASRSSATRTRRWSRPWAGAWRWARFALPTEDSVIAAEHLKQRFGLPLAVQDHRVWATMDAVRIMRAATGRDLVIKVEGAYHGSADGLAFSYWIDPAEAGPRDRPSRSRTRADPERVRRACASSSSTTWRRSSGSWPTRATGSPA